MIVSQWSITIGLSRIGASLDFILSDYLSLQNGSGTTTDDVVSKSHNITQFSGSEHILDIMNEIQRLEIFRPAHLYMTFHFIPRPSK